MRTSNQQLVREWQVKQGYWANLHSQCPRCNHLIGDLSIHICPDILRKWADKAEQDEEV